jgi:5'-3' exonuclease
MTLALLDGDAWTYRCGFAAEKTKYLVTMFEADDPTIYTTKFDSAKEAKEYATAHANTEIWTRKEYEPVENCLQMVKTSLENTLSVLGTDKFRLFLAGRGNFREDIFPDYKANRDGIAKPRYYRDIRNYLVSQWNAELVNEMEADDAIGIAATQLGASAVIVAVDKDLNQIPGSHYNWVTGKTYQTSIKDGMTFFYEQLLSGDPTDNIPGLNGIGAKRAKEALGSAANPQECAAICYAMYRKELGGPPDSIIDRNAKLLWIWRKQNDIHPFWRHFGREPAL